MFLTYVCPLSSHTCRGPCSQGATRRKALSPRSYQAGLLSKEQSEELLADARHGTFMVRESPNKGLRIAVKSGREIVHVVLYRGSASAKKAKGCRRRLREYRHRYFFFVQPLSPTSLSSNPVPHLCLFSRFAFLFSFSLRVFFLFLLSFPFPLQNCYYLSEDILFTSVEDLVEYYGHHDIVLVPALAQPTQLLHGYFEASPASHELTTCSVEALDPGSGEDGVARNQAEHEAAHRAAELVCIDLFRNGERDTRALDRSYDLAYQAACRAQRQESLRRRAHASSLAASPPSPQRVRAQSDGPAHPPHVPATSRFAVEAACSHQNARSGSPGPATMTTFNPICLTPLNTTSAATRSHSPSVTLLQQQQPHLACRSPSAGQTGHQQLCSTPPRPEQTSALRTERGPQSPAMCASGHSPSSPLRTLAPNDKLQPAPPTNILAAVLPSTNQSTETGRDCNVSAVTVAPPSSQPPAPPAQQPDPSEPLPSLTPEKPHDGAGSLSDTKATANSTRSSVSVQTGDGNSAGGSSRVSFASAPRSSQSSVRRLSDDANPSPTSAAVSLPTATTASPFSRSASDASSSKRSVFQSSLV